MLNDYDNGKCPTCTMSIRCPTWGELKCVVRKRWLVHNGPAECPDYKQRGKDFKEPRCQCEDCLKNDLLAEEYDEED